jgi:hypothetical protein
MLTAQKTAADARQQASAEKTPSFAQRPTPHAPPSSFLAALTFWTLAAVGIGVAWRTVRFFLQFPIWGDESFVCVNFLDNTFAGLLGPLRVGQICPLPFLWSELALYRWLGPSELVLRLVPYLAGLAALALFWPLCRRVLPPLPGSIAMALLAVSYYPVRHAVEVKPYSEDLLAALLLLVPAVRYIQGPRQTRWLVGLALLVPVAVVSSYPAVLIAGSINLALVPNVWRREKSARTWFVIYNLLLGAAFLGNYFLVGKPQLSPHEANPANAFNSTWREWFPDRDPVSLLAWFFKAHTGNMLAYPIGGPNFASSLTTALCLVGLWSWWRRLDRQVLGLLVWPFVLSMIAAILHKYPYGGSARLDQHLAPAICLLAGQGVAVVVERLASRTQIRRVSEGERGPLAYASQLCLFPLLLLTGFGAAGMIRDLVHPYKTTAELWNRTFVEDLMARVGPNDRVVIFHAPSEVRPGLEWYFRQHDDRVRWRGAIDWEWFDATAAKLWCVRVTMDKTLPDPILPAIAHGGRSPRCVLSYESVAPPEHGDEPEFAEVICFEGAGKTDEEMMNRER